VYFQASGKVLTLEGNLFYRNTASLWPVVYVPSGTASPSYNVVDAAFGTDTAQCGWAAGTGDVRITGGLPLSPQSFKLLSGSDAAGVITTLPALYPVADFYGNTITAPANAGAAQAVVTSGYYLDLSVKESAWGNAIPSNQPDEDGVVPAGTTLTATANPGYAFKRWVVNGVQETDNPLTLSGHSAAQAIFYRLISVTKFTDGTESGTLRHALTNALEDDAITFSGAPGAVIELGSVLPTITKSITIGGNGVILTRAPSWTASTSTQLLYISGAAVEVKISGLHFKNGLSAGYGGAIRTTGILTLESCIFSGNKNTRSSTSAGGGAINSSNTLTIRGCTFYGNNATNNSGAVYFSASGKTLTLEGNLFYENTADANWPTVRAESGTVVPSYNVVDVDFGTTDTQAGWAAGTGDNTFANLSIAGDPIDTGTFAPVVALQNILTSAPAGFPTTDFNGAARSFPGAPGAVR
jgi:hypothetical protein